MTAYFGFRMALVEPESRRQDHGVEGAVVQGQILQTAKGMREGMDGAQALLEGEAAFQRRHHHLVPRVAVGSVGDGLLDVVDRALQPVQRDRFRRRVVARAEIGLDAVRDGIHAGRGGQP